MPKRILSWHILPHLCQHVILVKAKTENSKKKMKKENQKQDDQIQFNLKQMHLSKIYQLLQLLLDTRIDNHPFGTRLKKPNVAFL